MHETLAAADQLAEVGWLIARAIKGYFQAETDQDRDEWGALIKLSGGTLSQAATMAAEMLSKAASMQRRAVGLECDNQPKGARRRAQPAYVGEMLNRIPEDALLQLRATRGPKMDS